MFRFKVLMMILLSLILLGAEASRRGFVSWKSLLINPFAVHESSKNPPRLLKEPETGQPLPQAKLYERGKNLFQRNCSACHGADRRGNPPQFPSLIQLDRRTSREEVLQLIRRGRGFMPGFPSLSRPERQALVYYLFQVDERSSE